MKQKILTIFTRTPLHVGAGSSVGAVDQPIIRERHTRFPVIPGSSIKGVMADLWPEREQAKDKEGKPRVNKDGKPVMTRVGDGRFLFGSDDANNAAAGAIMVGEARILAFPVRSAKGCFAWLTCPLALSRFQRDTGCASLETGALSDEQALVSEGSSLLLDGKVVFEEYALDATTTLSPTIVDTLAPLCSDSVWVNDLKKQLAVVSNDLFAYFVENACEVAQHIKIDDESGVVQEGALFNQENVPSEALFYSVVAAQDGKGNDKERPATEAFDLLQAKFNDSSVGNLLQIGADLTTGLGWCSVKIV
ncbi:MAG: type III-B CRISPR module RAMP protein Cmr4 [Lentisphaerae bacterium]|nr:type III-B CRISPR module RAMP protein Cmr4 [Lentisphaerota bacterium]